MRLCHLLFGPVVIAAAVVVSACSDDEASPSGDQQTEAPQTIDVEMTLEDFDFSPASINLDLGDEVFVELANDGDEEHTFTIDEFFVDETLASGEDRDVTFTPNEPGEFTFYCKNHPDTMQGSLRVARPGEAAQPTEDDDEGGGAGIGY